MKAVLISIQPKWVELIAAGKKTVELRKTKPSIKPPFRCYMYMSKYHWAFDLLRKYGMEELAERLMFETGKVIGEFTCDRIFPITVEENGPLSEERGGGYSEEYSAKGFSDCLTDEEFDTYLSGKPGYGWHISDLVIYDELKKLDHFMRKPCDFAASCGACNHSKWSNCRFDGCEFTVTRPPQSWCYVEAQNEKDNLP